MKANGLLLCRSLSATAVCASDDPRSMILSRRGKTVAEGSRLIDFRYSRLGESRRLMSSGERRRPSVKLAMVAKNDKLPPSSNHHALQVVVMRVSLHCNGCARKVRRHISKMEGVTSFSIDLESKRVTVMGHVSPVGVLESISKVKKAEFWPSC